MTPLKILVIESDPSAVEALAGRLGRLNVPSETTAFRTAEEALEYLEGRALLAGPARKSLPQIIFLGTSGTGDADLLARLRKHQDFRFIPVVVIGEPPAREKKEEGIFFLPKTYSPEMLEGLLKRAEGLLS